jgi:hypothetical protein
MAGRVLLGMLTPSSNTVLEPVTAAMLAGLPEVSAHFGRFRVTEIALSRQALGQFDDGCCRSRSCTASAGTAPPPDGSASTPTSGCASASPRRPGFPPAPRCSR